jgi:urease accessory protein UreF
MKYISEQMIRLMERLSEMFPGSSYQNNLDAYLSTKGITDAAQLESYIQQYHYSQKEKNI